MNGRRWLITGSCVLVAAIYAFAQPQTSSSSPWLATKISADELAKVRPVALPDLERLLQTIDNDKPSAEDVENEFRNCQFTLVRLGRLGIAVVVEAQAGHGKTNAAMLNVYAPSGNSYRRIVEAAGFGPEIFPGSASVPDLVFGWASGVCHTQYERYRYRHGRYSVDACNQEQEPPGQNWNGDSCIIKSCGGAMPTFPQPSKAIAAPKS
jgi:hypothetical protein